MLVFMGLILCEYFFGPIWAQFHQRSMYSFTLADPKSVKRH